MQASASKYPAKKTNGVQCKTGLRGEATIIRLLFLTIQLPLICHIHEIRRCLQYPDTAKPRKAVYKGSSYLALTADNSRVSRQQIAPLTESWPLTIISSNCYWKGAGSRMSIGSASAAEAHISHQILLNSILNINSRIINQFGYMRLSWIPQVSGARPASQQQQDTNMQIAPNVQVSQFSVKVKVIRPARMETCFRRRDEANICPQIETPEFHFKGKPTL